jgi:hypothetical protein
MSVTGLTVVVTAVLETGSVIELEHDGGRALAQVRWSMQPAGHHPRYGCVFIATDKAFEAWIHAHTCDVRPGSRATESSERGADVIPARRRPEPSSPAVARRLEPSSPAVARRLEPS